MHTTSGNLHSMKDRKIEQIETMFQLVTIDKTIESKYFFLYIFHLKN